MYLQRDGDGVAQQTRKYVLHLYRDRRKDTWWYVHPNGHYALQHGHMLCPNDRVAVQPRCSVFPIENTWYVSQP
jgi:hypothetical protein